MNPSQLIDKQCFPSSCHKWFNGLQLDSIKKQKEENPLWWLKKNVRYCGSLFHFQLFLNKKKRRPLLETDFGCREYFSIIYCYFWSSHKPPKKKPSTYGSTRALFSAASRPEILLWFLPIPWQVSTAVSDVFMVRAVNQCTAASQH